MPTMVVLFILEMISLYSVFRCKYPTAWPGKSG